LLKNKMTIYEVLTHTAGIPNLTSFPDYRETEWKESRSAIYYTTNGSTPTSSSLPYAGAFLMSGTTTVRAVAIAGGISSLLVAGTYTLPGPNGTPWVPPVTSTLVFLSAPANVVSGSVISPALQVALEDPSGAVLTQFEGQISLSLAPTRPAPRFRELSQPQR
jgi:hypothetical protein